MTGDGTTGDGTVRAETADGPKAGADGWDWARVEIFGHRTHYGRVREEERFGTKMLRIDVPNNGRPETDGWTTILYGGGSIFSVVPIDEATAMSRNRPWDRPWERPRPALTAPSGIDSGDDGAGDDGEPEWDA